MISVNTTFVIAAAHQDDFVEFLRGEFLPAMQRAGIFRGYLVQRVLTQLEPDTESVAVMLRGGTEESAAEWMNEMLPAVMCPIEKRLGSGKLLYFTTLLEDMDV